MAKRDLLYIANKIILKVFYIICLVKTFQLTNHFFSFKAKSEDKGLNI